MNSLRMLKKKKVLLKDKSKAKLALGFYITLFSEARANTFISLA